MSWNQKDYFRFEQDQCLGLVCSPNCNAIYADREGQSVICAGLEAVNIWNIRTGLLEQRWLERSQTDQVGSEAVLIVASPADINTFAVAYADGSARVWRREPSNTCGSAKLTFQGHRGVITAMAFDATGTRLATAGRDTDIVVWDLVGECGLYRLGGHTNAVTGLAFVGDRWLVSVSKDTLMKVWDLTCHQCIETAVMHHVEITALVCLRTNWLVTAGVDKAMRLFEFKEDAEDGKRLELLQVVNRTGSSSTDRVLSIQVDAKQRYVAVACDRSIEVWKVRSMADYELLKTKNKEKVPSWFKHKRYAKISLGQGSKIKSIAFPPSQKMINSKHSLELLVGLADNRLTKVEIPFDTKLDVNMINLSLLDLQGHRSEGRAVCFSKDEAMVATAAKESIKVWNTIRGSLILTIPLEKVTALAFWETSTTEERTMLATDETGRIHLIDLALGQVIDSVVAHENASIRCLALRPDGRGMITGGADKMVKFWEFKVSHRGHGRRHLKLLKSLQMGDEIMALRYSPDLRYIALALMDLTIKVFFEDSLKFYLSLYGHKLPITDIDISSDSKLLISASADKNIKIWSLEFGECRKSIFAHDDAITAIGFIPDTKLFFSASKDRVVRFWDLEGYRPLQKLVGHQGEVWAMAISSRGDAVATVARDRSIRIWRQGEELLFPEEEQERELEVQFEKSMIDDNPYERIESGESNGRISLRTVSSMKAGERIMEFIEAADEERRRWDEYELGRSQGITLDRPTPGPMFLAFGKDKTPAEFVLFAFDTIPMPEIEDALLCLPLSALPSLLFYINEWLKGRRNVVMTARILEFTLRIFLNNIISSPSLRPLLRSIRDLEQETLREFRSLVGFNTMAIKKMRKL